MKRFFLSLALFLIIQLPVLWIMYQQNKTNKKNEHNIAACETLMAVAFNKQDECLDRLDACIDLVAAYQGYMDTMPER